ncbi:MAG: hypothetical protein LBQ82_06295 [Treponema sp.]|jgi:hypothetical protein|nr:hypothetical protein [Treponema sp.]
MSNKINKFILLITVIVFITISCDKKPALKNIETDEILIETGEVQIDVSYADESFFEKYAVYDSFIDDEDYILIAFTTNVPVKDFSWLSVSINFDDNDELFYEIDKVLYSIEELHPEKPFVASWTEVGIMSCFGFSYRDEDGQKKYFVGRTGNYGEDPEEYEGPAFVYGEFFPIKNLVGRYKYTAEWPYNEDENTLILDLTETSYTLKANDVEYTGVAVFSFDDDRWYISLDEIKWAHNWIVNFLYGIPDPERFDEWVDEETYGVVLWLDEGNELEFQNRGGPMVPYVIFDGIGDMWVRLTK